MTKAATLRVMISVIGCHRTTRRIRRKWTIETNLVDELRSRSSRAQTAVRQTSDEKALPSAESKTVGDSVTMLLYGAGRIGPTLTSYPYPARSLCGSQAAVSRFRRISQLTARPAAIISTPTPTSRLTLEPVAGSSEGSGGTVGAGVGATVGATVGEAVGATVGEAVGDVVGGTVGGAGGTATPSVTVWSEVKLYGPATHVARTVKA
jgi:hypothetical protein